MTGMRPGPADRAVRLRAAGRGGRRGVRRSSSARSGCCARNASIGSANPCVCRSRYSLRIRPMRASRWVSPSAGWGFIRCIYLPLVGLSIADWLGPSRRGDRATGPLWVVRGRRAGVCCGPGGKGDDIGPEGGCFFDSGRSGRMATEEHLVSRTLWARGWASACSTARWRSCWCCCSRRCCW